MEAQPTRRRALSILAVAGVAGAAITTGVVGGGEGVGGGPDEARASALAPFDSCDELVSYARDHRWALNPSPYVAIDGEPMLAQATVLEDSAARLSAAPEAGAVAPAETGTNVQEAGIDEPDIAKLSGTTLLTVRGKTLAAYDVGGDDAILQDEIEIELAKGSGEADLLIAGDKALVTSTGFEKTLLTELDISEPQALTPLRELEIEGVQVSARLQGATVRLVVESQPDYPGLGNRTPDPEPLPEEDPPTGATGETGPEPEPDVEPAWLPQASLTDLATDESTSGPLTGCTDISYPESFSGLGLLSVLTIDLESGLEPADVDSVVTDGSTVYASATGLYVATTKMTPPRGDGIVESIGRLIAPDATTTVPAPQASGETAIHRFAASDAPTTEYAASGEVRGRLIGQFAMSESEGMLRVASTVGDSFIEGPGESESMITVLSEDEGSLSEVGRVGGLGRGEEIYAVRFIGDRGYVVTFEQTDPLYTVDLGDPENPELTGELKIPGYSAYLHPVADGRLLGIGQAGTANGTITGAQASLFDVADAERPERLDAIDLSEGSYGSTQTEWDHHAFLFSPEHALAVVPVESYGRNSLNGAVAMHVDSDSGLTEVARLEDDGQIQRMLVADENLVTVSSRGVTVRALEAL